MERLEMDYLRLDNLAKSKEGVGFVFSVSGSVSQYLRTLSFDVSYDETIESVPESILNIVFVANFLPLAWVLDAKIIVPELDEDFYNSIPCIKEGYKNIYPDWNMGGYVECGRLVRNSAPEASRSAAFFSGGLDAVHTMLSHLDEKPDLVSIWGADIACSNEKGWRQKLRHIQAIAQKVDLPDIAVRSNFREIEDEGALEKIVRPILKDGWWHGIKHALPFFGMVAPIAYLRGYAKIYVASSHCRQYERATCASNPWSDNEVRFCGSRIVHDGYDFARQDKARFVVEKCKETGVSIPLHVCWRTQTGDNCCRCEKCFRTITEILVEGGAPEELGFPGYGRYYKPCHVIPVLIKTFNAENRIGRRELNRIWTAAKNRILERRAELRNSPHRSVFKWMLAHDFMGTETLEVPFAMKLLLKVRNILSRIYHRVAGK